MSYRSFVLVGVLAVMIAVTSTPVIGQVNSAAPSSSYVPPKTPWGDPDIQGIWRSVGVGGLERPADATSEFVSDKEIEDRINAALELRGKREKGEVFQFGHRFQPNYNDIFGVDKGMHSSGVMLNTRSVLRRRWAIVDPLDG